MQDEPEILREDADGLSTLTLNRPSKLNALTPRMFALLEGHLDDIAGRADQIGCVLLRGAGKCFCAGADLTFPEGDMDEDARWRGAVLGKFQALPQPTIAAVHGHCLTGGLELSLATDLIIAAESASFADTHGRWGFVATWGMNQRLPRVVGLNNAKAMIWTSRRFGGRDAVRLGLAVACFPDAVFEGEVARYVRDILANSWHSNFGSKALLNVSRELSLTEGLKHEFMRHPGRSPDSAERVAGFVRS